MTGPHPRAVDTLLPEFEAWRPAFTPNPLRWWQRVVAARVLEVDELGDLVWRQVLLSTARQLGKSTLIRELGLWFIQQEDRWGEVRDALMISRDEKTAKEVLRPGQMWVKRVHAMDWDLRQGNGENEVSYRDNRFLVRAKDSAYGYSAAHVIADECWSLQESVVSEGIEPLLVEKRNGQLILLSTAHRSASRLMRTRRATAIEELGTPSDTILLEWSAPPEAELDDVAAWRQASPFWSERREDLIRSRVRGALAGTLEVDADEPDAREFVRSQWLNIWPTTAAPRQPGVSLVPEARWDELRFPGLHVPNEPVTAAVEAIIGHPAALAAAWRMPDGRIATVARTVPSIEAAWVALGNLPAGSTLLCGLSWRTHQRAQDMGVEGVGQRETEQALPLLSDLVEAGAIAWDGDELGGQVRNLRVVDSSSGSGKTLIKSQAQTHLARAMAWSVWKLDQGASFPAVW